MGFMNRDEATLLHNIALQFQGKAVLEIGGWLGWSTCHLALAAVILDVIDPAHADPDFRAHVEQSLGACGVEERVNLTGLRSPEGVHELAADDRRIWSLVVVDGDHEPPAPENDVSACLPYVAPDCAFVFHDLASPSVAAALPLLQREGFQVLVYQTQQIMGIAWRGNVTPVKHVPDPDVPWQLPHHLIGLPVSGVDFDKVASNGHTPSINSETKSVAVPESAQAEHNGKAAAVQELRDIYKADPGNWRPSVCIVSNEVIGPFKNGGIGTSMTGLAELLADSGSRVTILYTGGVWEPDINLDGWKKRYAELGIEFIPMSLEDMSSLDGPVKNSGFGTPYLVYRFLASNNFDVVHFNDCAGDGSLCLVARKLGLAFTNSLMVLALHSPSRWVFELNHTLPIHLLYTAFNYAERISVTCADVLWSPSRYLVEWARSRGFRLPRHTFIQQYCLPSQRLRERRAGPSEFPKVSYGRTAPPKEIVFFGRLEERKGLQLFCNAMHALRHELARRNVTVTFLGKAQKCAGMPSLEFIAERSKDWYFRVRTITDLGQPEALDYLRGGERLAVIASPVDNSPCTVYEALAWGIPFLATRTGGVPELIDEADQEHVLFEGTTEALCTSLRDALDAGGWIAAPSQSQDEVRRVWKSFHADAQRYLPAPRTETAAPRVVAIVDAQSGSDLQLTINSLKELEAVSRVVVLNRCGEGPQVANGSFTARTINLSIDQAGQLDDEIAGLKDEAVLLVHSGISIRADKFAEMLLALSASDIDGLQPAAEVIGETDRKAVPPLGGDPSFALFEGPTFTGGLLVRGAALKRAMFGRDFVIESAFMGLADFCMTRGQEIWPYPELVFERSANWTLPTHRSLPARLKLFDESSPTDRYYMLAMGYGATHLHNRTLRPAALALVDAGLPRLVRVASRTRRLVGKLRNRAPFGPSVDRYLKRLLRRGR